MGQGGKVEQNELGVEEGQEELVVETTGEGGLEVLEIGLGGVEEERRILLLDQSEVLVREIRGEGDLTTREGCSKLGSTTN